MAGQPTLATGAGMIQNRADLDLDPAELLAEAADLRRLREAARETRNWSLVGVLRELAIEASQAVRTRWRHSR